MILKGIVKAKFQKFGQDTIILSTFKTFCFFQNLIPYLLYVLFWKEIISISVAGLVFRSSHYSHIELQSVYVC